MGALKQSSSTLPFRFRAGNFRGFVCSNQPAADKRLRALFDSFGSSVGDARCTESSVRCKQFAPRSCARRDFQTRSLGHMSTGSFVRQSPLARAVCIFQAVDDSHVIADRSLFAHAQRFAWVWSLSYGKRGKGALVVNESAHTHSRGSRL